MGKFFDPACQPFASTLGDADALPREKDGPRGRGDKTFCAQRNLLILIKKFSGAAATSRRDEPAT